MNRSLRRDEKDFMRGRGSDFARPDACLDGPTLNRGAPRDIKAVARHSGDHS